MLKFPMNYNIAPLKFLQSIRNTRVFSFNKNFRFAMEFTLEGRTFFFFIAKKICKGAGL